MKKLIFACALITICIGSYAQSDTSRKYNNEPTKNSEIINQKNDNINSECAVRMEQGKVWMTVDGKTVVLDKEMTLKDGTIVMRDGKIKMKEGKTVQLNEGDCVDNSGKMIVVKNSQIKKDTAKNNTGTK